MLAEAAPAPEVLSNTVVKNLLAFARRAWKKRWPVTFVSATGVGKTEAVRFAAATLPFPVRRIDCKQVTTKYSLLESMALAPGERRKRHGDNYQSGAVLYDLALERFSKDPYLLIIDEADRLRNDCFEMLRDFYDDARLPMLLVGNEVLTEKINRQHERLFRRIKARHEQRPLDRAGLGEVLQFRGYKMSDAEFDFVWKLVGGSPGFAEALLDCAIEMAESNGQKLNMEALTGAAQYFPVLRRKM